MGRKRGYERDALVAKAMGAFHRLGYKGASTEVLVRELGVNRNSVYSEFGSKSGLFSATLELYEERVVSRLFGPLESARANLDEIEALYRKFPDSIGNASGLGCLMCNTAAELAGSDVSLQPHVQIYFDRMYEAFRNALQGAVHARQIAIGTNIDFEARLLMSSCLGIFLMARAGIERSAALETIEASLSHLQSLRATDTTCARRA
jgi:TetR/AcrR family transcriptional repressor of nem operon